MNKDKLIEIFRACRLCGVGAGYKMPIIQNIIDERKEEVDLKQKIKDCVQIEVNIQDPMPPLICELCADKIQDFYEFRKMCHETNKQTRMKLGLPLQTWKSSESILGVTEPLNTDSDDGEPLAKQHDMKKPTPKSAKIKMENDVKQESFNVRSRSSSVEVSEKRCPSSKRVTRRTDEPALTHLVDVQVTKSTRSRPGPKSVKNRLEIDISNCELQESFNVRSRSSSVEVSEKRCPSSKRVTRRTDEPALTHLVDVQVTKSTRSRPGPKSVKNRLEIDISNCELTNDNSLLAPRAKRGREVPLETPPPVFVKKSKISQEPSKPEKTPKSVPTFSRLPPQPTPPPKSQKAGPKSRKLDTTPTKSQKFDTPKSKNSETSECTPRSRKAETQPTQLSKSKSDLTKLKTETAKSKPGLTPVMAPPKVKKREESMPAPKSKKSRQPSPKPEAPAQWECKICDAKVKTQQGLYAHSKVHTVGYTPPELACNACELWFATVTAASAHNSRHLSGLPYTCSRCYGDFRTHIMYDMHFVRKQCIPTYEVADVKCEECWKTFPTYKLMEEHRCPGEGGRPGGKCVKCKRFYVTLKSLRTHEFRCTQKRKETVKIKMEPQTEETSPPTDAAKGMLPMQVRIAKCDKLIDITHGHCDVAGLPHRFGLDRNSTYPYFYSMGDTVKQEPSTTFDPMVAINDDIKQEYLKDNTTEDSFVHWDSDESTDNETDVSSPKSVKSLSKISLKTLFSPKCLGKVPKRERKVKPETYESVLSVGFGENRNISNIIENLGHESNHSGEYDSDSILDKNAEKNDGGNISEQNSSNIAEIAKADTVKPSEEIDNTDRISNTEQLESNDIVIDDKQIESNNGTNISQDAIDKGISEPIEVAENDTRTEEDSGSAQKITDDSEPIESSEQSAKITATSPNNESECKSSPKNGHLTSNKIVSENIVENITPELENTDVEMNEQTTDEPKNTDIKLDGSDTDSQLSEAIDTTDVLNVQQDEPDMVDKMDDDHKANDSNDVKNDGKDDCLTSEKTKENVTDETENETADEKNDMTNAKENCSSVCDDVCENDDSSHIKDDITDVNDGLSHRANDEVSENKTADEKNDMTNENDDCSSVSNDKVCENDDSSHIKDDITDVNDGLSHRANDEVSVNESSYATNDCANESSDPVNENDESNHRVNENDSSAKEDVDETKNNLDKDSIDSEFSITKEDEANKEMNTSRNSGESLITENDLVSPNKIQSVDKFNINNLDEEDKLLMAELDAQIGENYNENKGGESQNDAINGNDDTFKDGGENTNVGSYVTGENTNVVSHMSGENTNVVSHTTDENTNVNSENTNFNTNNDCANENKSFEDKRDTLDMYINKQDDLKSLSLDNISDDEFNFDI